MDKEYSVICPDEDLNENDEFILSIQKAILVTILEKKKITQNQYNYACELLEKKLRAR